MTARSQQMPPMFLAAWGNLASLITAIIPHAPELSPRLMYAPSEDFHCYGAYLRLAPVHDMSIEALATQLCRPPRELLREVLPEGNDDILLAFTLVEDPVVLSARSYRRLDLAVRGPGRSIVLSGHPITLMHLCHAEVLAPLDPLVGAASRILERDLNAARDLHAMITLLRAAGCLSDEQAARSTLRSVDLDGFKAFVQAQLTDAKAPACSMVLSPGMRAILSVADLRESVARLKPAKFTNMAAEFGLVTGGMVILELCSPESGLVFLNQEPFGLFSLGATFGQFGLPLSSWAQSKLLLDLQAAGVKTGPICIREAIESLFGEEISHEYWNMHPEAINDSNT